jgi:hypothetical protein
MQRSRSSAPQRASKATATLAVALVVLVGCGGEDAPVGGADSAATDTSGADTGLDAVANDSLGGGADAGAVSDPTWHRDIKPMLTRACLGCHKQGGIGPFDLAELEMARTMGHAMVGAVNAGRMPPWGAQDTEACTPPLPWQDDLRLSPADKATLAAWVDAGGPEGDPSTAPKSTKVPKDGLEHVHRAMKPEVAYLTKGTKDDFVCFVLDPKFDADAWIRGVHFRAGDARVAHHALLFVDESGAAAGKANKDGYYPCFGGPGVNGRLIAAWAPGGVPAVLPEAAGLPVSKGAKLVMQMHYHPIGVEVPDATTVELELHEGTPKWTALSMLIGNFGSGIGGGDGLQPGPGDSGAPIFKIPAGAADHTETMRWTVPKFSGLSIGGLRVYGVASHMHYVGKDMRIWVERGSPEGVCPDAVRESLGACLDAHCGGKEGSELVTCAVATCGKEVNGAPSPCQQCLAGASAAGSAQMWSVCAPQTEVQDDVDACLLHTPSWDFAWQRFYFYDAPAASLPSLRTGDKLWMQCRYNNSMSNAGVKAALAEQGKDAPADVYLGEETLDEMCLAALYLLYPTTPKP